MIEGVPAEMGHKAVGTNMRPLSADVSPMRYARLDAPLD
jgi:hypothetical protein